MKITIDKLNLFQWCKANGKNYQNTRNRILAALKPERIRKPKKTYKQILLEARIRNRIRYGYTQEEAFLNKKDFDKLRATRYGSHKIGRYNLRYVCSQLGISYNTVFIHCIERKRMTPREYLESKGYDLTQFEE